MKNKMLEEINTSNTSMKILDLSHNYWFNTLCDLLYGGYASFSKIADDFGTDVIIYAAIFILGRLADLASPIKLKSSKWDWTGMFIAFLIVVIVKILYFDLTIITPWFLITTLVSQSLDSLNCYKDIFKMFNICMVRYVLVPTIIGYTITGYYDDWNFFAFLFGIVTALYIRRKFLIKLVQQTGEIDDFYNMLVEE